MLPSISKGKNVLLAVDTETTMRCDRDGFSSSTPWHHENHILQIGFWDGNDEPCAWSGMIPNLSLIGDKEDQNFVVCGHNIKFDLHYIRKDNEDLYNDIMSCTLWDTSIAHYIMTGQRDKFPTLEQCIKYWLPADLAADLAKGDLIKKLIDEGKTTEDASPDVLREYMLNDIKATWHVAEAQIHYASENGFIRLIHSQCTALKAIVEMECNGIYLDLMNCAEAEVALVKEQRAYENAMLALTAHRTLKPGSPRVPTHVDFSTCANSNKLWSAVFFGGSYTFTYKVPDGEYKSGIKKGKPKFKNEYIDVEFAPEHSPILFGAKRTKQGIFSVSEDVITKLGKIDALAKALSAYRKIEKTLNTYIRALPTKVWGTTIHPNINQTATNTGRTSQSNPNLQNQSGDDIVKELFRPRNGYALVEADYKQIEMIAFALTYRDPVLLDDLRHGTDVHDVVATSIWGSGYTKEQRRIVKGVNFGTIYGGGVETISKQSGLDQTVVWDIIRAFYGRYRTIKPTRQRLMKMVAGSPITKDETLGWYGLLPSEFTGRVYSIPVTKLPCASGFDIQASYTKTSNYPIQGLATGDWVPMMLGYLYNRLKETTLDIRMINTVHDSVLFEVPVDSIARCCEYIKEHLENLPAVFESVFNQSLLDIPINVDVQWSTKSWGGPWTKYEHTPF